jgi:two-component system sensor histidine kinase KdpD
MADERPDPEELPRRVVDEESREKRGRLTVFFGAAPGVGKTYAMLEAARAEMEQEKRDVVVGVVETHGRYETAALVLGLDLLAQKSVMDRGVEVHEFDLDAALTRRPDLILIDELAHTNTEGCRHPKRWQDVDELLNAGIDVFSTMNVQHVESLHDVIAKVTGIVVRETVPDSMLEGAHDIKLVDLPPDDLMDRLREGKVYVPAQAQRAIENFFRKGNLIALRELALRHTAERVDAHMRAYRRAQGIEETWAVADQILVAVSPSPYSARLVRAARRMASALHARWFAVFVELRNARQLSPKGHATLARNLRLAEQLGAEVITLSGDDATAELVRFARERNITKIILGKPLSRGLRDHFAPSLVDRVVRSSGDIDVYVTAGDQDPEQAVSARPRRAPLHVPSFLAAALGSGFSTAVAYVFFGRDQLPDVVMIYLLGIMLVSSRFGFGPSILAAFLSVAALNFFFVTPFFTFAIADFRHAVTFIVMFLVAVVISGLTQRVRNQAASARHREERTRNLYELSRELAATLGSQRVIEVSAGHLEKVFKSAITVFAPGAERRLLAAYPTAGSGETSERELSIAQWVWSNRKEAGLGTTTLRGGATLYLPLMASGGPIGVLGVTPGQADRFDGVEERRQIDAFAAQMALAMERAQLSEETEQARREVETEQLRSSLLSSVSHDLRTPLAVITGAASTLVEGEKSIDEATRLELMHTILDESERLNRLIRNLLDMTRLESGTVRVNKEWLALEEVVGAALHRLETRLAGREVRVEIPRDLPLVPFDVLLIEQTLINLLENAVKYSEGPLEVRVTPAATEALVEVADRGPGIPAGQEPRVFEKFYRAPREGGPSGVGLGLAICRAIVTAHGGRIWVQNREGGGASFRFTLPTQGDPPRLELSEALQARAGEHLP